jgi:chromodomain-helicase-DNA-binding protein 4
MNGFGMDWLVYMINLVVSWLYSKWCNSQACILADEMGLGKTVQIACFLYLLYYTWSQSPFLVIVPNSVLANWERELKKWAPFLVTCVYAGIGEVRDIIYRQLLYPPSVHERCSSTLAAHVVLTTFEFVIRESNRFLGEYWSCVVVDEAQRLKGESTQLYSVIQRLKRKHTVLMTGTPLNNRLQELFQLMHTIDPEKFQNPRDLEEKYSAMTEPLMLELHEVCAM